MWQSWVGVVLGIWLIISPFLLKFAESGAKWNSVIVGILVAAAAIWANSEAQSKGVSAGA